MKTAIIITTPDFAGLNIKENLLEHFQELDEKFRTYAVYACRSLDLKMYTTDDKCINAENIDKEIDADLFLFPTTHRAASNVHSLSCHIHGNWGEAELGGKPKTLSIAPANMLKELFKELNRQGKNLKEEITMEATHHGPELNKPTVFLEIGSNETQWKRKDLGKVMADVIMKVLLNKIPTYETAVGIGGTHYCANFNRIQLESDIAIGHICPKYNLHHLDKEMLLQAINKTEPKATLVLLDWKGLGEHKQRIISLLEEIGITWKKTKEFKR